MTELSEHQKEALAAIAQRLRQQAEELEKIVRAGSREPLSVQAPPRSHRGARRGPLAPDGGALTPRFARE
jgi:hypothetical protein